MARFEELVGRYVYLTINGVEYRVYFEESGQGIPFLLQHTAGSDGQQYRRLMNDEEFTKVFRFIAYDLPFHGKSLPPNSVVWWEQDYKLSLDFLIKFHEALMEALEISRPVYMGMSMGGHLAADLAYYKPEAYRACLGLEGSLKAHPNADKAKNYELLDNPNVNQMSIASHMERFASPYAKEDIRKEIGFIYSNNPPYSLRGDLNYYMTDHDLTGKAEKIDTSKCPLYMFGGTYDNSTPPDNVMEVEKVVKGAKAIIMQNLGHFCIIEDYEATKAYLKPVLNEVLVREGLQPLK